MRHVLMRVTLAVAAATMISPVKAQMSSSIAAVPQWPPVAAPPSEAPVPYFGGAYQSYPILAPTPRDAYRDGTINRWELERLEGPLPQALQGPSVDGNRGGDGGGGGFSN